MFIHWSGNSCKCVGADLEDLLNIFVIENEILNRQLCALYRPLLQPCHTTRKLTLDNQGLSVHPLEFLATQNTSVTE